MALQDREREIFIYCCKNKAVMPRLLLKFTSVTGVSSENFDKHYFQSLIYSRLQEIGITNIHEGTKFRFFTFSDFFPSGPMKPGDHKSVIVSSPSAEFINSLRESMERSKEVYLGNATLSLAEISAVEFSSSPNAFITGSPVVLYKDNRQNLYFSMRRGDSLAFFMMRIKENAVKRYRQYSGDSSFELPHPLFDSAVFNREVAVRVSKGKDKFIIIGSAWYKLERFRRQRRDEQFYRFLMDAGLGEKSSLGFGFLNPLKGDKAA